MKLRPDAIDHVRAKNGFSGLVSQSAKCGAAVLGRIERHALPVERRGRQRPRQARMDDIARSLGEHDVRRPAASPFFTPTRENRLAIW